MSTRAERLARRLEEDICKVCVHRTADHRCALSDSGQCPIFRWAEQLAALVQELQSDRLQDYEARIQASICPECHQAADGTCSEREHLNCPLDLYLALVLEIFEEDLATHGR